MDWIGHLDFIIDCSIEYFNYCQAPEFCINFTIWFICNSLVNGLMYLKFINIFTPYFPRPEHTAPWYLIYVLQIIPYYIGFLQVEVQILVTELNVKKASSCFVMIVQVQKFDWTKHTCRNKPIEFERWSGARSSVPVAWKSLESPYPTSPAT